MLKRILALLLLLAVFGGLAQAQRTPQELYEGNFPAPEFPAALDWFNVENPLTMSGLVGKIVIFDFWTYGCVNCLHIIPIMEQIEQKYANEVVVIGVHSAKFSTEGQTENLRQIVQRYGVHHPVVNDNQFEIWRAYGVNAWPTVVIIDPRGKAVIRQSGEIPFEAFDTYLTGMIEHYDGIDESIINRTPLELALEGAGDPGTPLLYPGKVMADEASDRLFIADSSHNRIVITDLTTREVVDIIGTAERGFTDGGFDEATFDKPQGMALDGNLLYIADVNNHVIRVADLAARQVITVAGNGIMGRSRHEFGARISNPLGVSLRSPGMSNLMTRTACISRWRARISSISTSRRPTCFIPRSAMGAKPISTASASPLPNWRSRAAYITPARASSTSPTASPAPSAWPISRMTWSALSPARRRITSSISTISMVNWARTACSTL